MKLFKLLALISLCIILAVGCGNGNENVNSNVNLANENNSGETSQEISFPEKSIELFVPYAAGGGTDIVARTLASATEQYLGQDIVVINKTGGGGAVGMSEGADAKPDGYTVTMITNALSLFPHQDGGVSYEDFIPVAKINHDPSVVMVGSDSEFGDIQELLDYASENPGELSIGNTGGGMEKDSAGALIEEAADVEFTHVPFEGAAPTIAALLGGHIDFMTTTLGEAKAQIDSGELIPLAIVANQRSESYPDVPTFQEATGLEINQFGPWRGLGVPVGTPDEIVQILSDAFTQGVEDPEFSNFMKENAFEIDFMNPEEFGQFLIEDYELNGELLELIQ